VSFSLATERLLLRPWTPNDLDGLYAVLADPAVARWLGQRTRDEVAERLARHVEHQRNHGFSMWAVVERASGALIGHCGLQHLDGGPEVEVGWALASDRWDRGYATEAGRASLHHGFDVLGLDEIVAVTRPENLASRRVMEKLRMEYDGRGVYYGWEQVKYASRRVPDEPVRVVDYDLGWPAQFAEERARLVSALGDAAAAIEHIGSTAVAGLAAKPIIDIMVGLRRAPLGEEHIVAVTQLGYEYRGEFGIPGRQYFRRGRPRTHQLHVVQHGSAFWETHLLFRDHLRAHPSEAERYAALKRELAGRFRESRASYSEAKGTFIEQVLATPREVQKPA
jgi:GrpB-like predicted nucleotidyltransferase (UPF0157 family)/predicted acetyltransferase